MIDQELLDAYKNDNLILFIGAGVSKNLNLPDWKELISEIANELSSTTMYSLHTVIT